MDQLERAMLANRPEIERALAAAREELQALKARERSVETAIRRAEEFLGLERKPPVDRDNQPRKESSQMVLHDALARVLRAHDNRPMTARELTDEINRTAWYQRADGENLEPRQVHARVHNYGRMFLREEGGIRLRDEELRENDPDLLRRFDRVMLEVYDAAMREVRYPARRFLHMVRTRGGLVAARHLLAKAGVSEGFARLREAAKLDLSMEYQVLRPEFAALFTTDELDVARHRLVDAGFPASRLP